MAILPTIKTDDGNTYSLADWQTLSPASYLIRGTARVKTDEYYIYYFLLASTLGIDNTIAVPCVGRDARNIHLMVKSRVAALYNCDLLVFEGMEKQALSVTGNYRKVPFLKLMILNLTGQMIVLDADANVIEGYQHSHVAF